MSLPARERRRLRGIQSALDRSDPRLASLFMTFSLLTQEEEMPHCERLRVRVDRFTARGRHLRTALLGRLRVMVIAPVALAATVGALVLGGWSGVPGACRAPATAAHASDGSTFSRTRLALCQSRPWSHAMMAVR
jgi:hypothetical protein